MAHMKTNTVLLLILFSVGRQSKWDKSFSFSFWFDFDVGALASNMRLLNGLRKLIHFSLLLILLGAPCDEFEYIGLE